MSVWTSVLILSNSDWNYVTPGIGECGWEVWMDNGSAISGKQEGKKQDEQEKTITTVYYIK